MQGQPAVVDTRRPSRQDTFDLRDQIQQDDHSHLHAHAEAASSAGGLYTISMDEDHHSVLEDDSEGEEGDHDDMEYDDDDSSLSIPNESIDFDLVYALHSFAATVEGQANVVRGDSLYLMDDSNSYWWLVRVLKTQEVGYIPAENIETPFERLARLNKHRNVDLATATQAELSESLSGPAHTRLPTKTPSPLPRGPLSQSRQAHRRGISFRATRKVHRYLPAIWHEELDESEGEWSDSSFEDQDPGLALEYPETGWSVAAAAAVPAVGNALGGAVGDAGAGAGRGPVVGESPFGEEGGDPMGWDPEVVRQPQGRQVVGAPVAVQAGVVILRDQQMQDQERLAQQQQQMQIQQQREVAVQQQQGQQQQGQQMLRPSESRERLVVDPLQAIGETRKISVTPNIARGGDEATNPYLTGSAASTPTPTQNRLDEEREREKEREKRAREEEAEEARKRAKSKEREKTVVSPVSSTTSLTKNGSGKLKKERGGETDDESAPGGGKKEKKKSSMFGSLFKKKDKERKEKNASVGSIDSGDYASGRLSEESRSTTRSSTVEGIVSPTTATAMQQQQQQSLNVLRASQDMKRPGPEQTQTQTQAQTQTPDRDRQVSSHASQLRQRDEQQQRLYQEYLNRSPSSVREVQPSYGFQSASAVMASANNYLSPTTAGGVGGGGKPRPGSLILTGSIMDGPGVPELSVVRVFAGKNLQTEATFKTVLLNSSTTAADLIRQATQRFRLPQGPGESPSEGGEGEYYLTIKRVEAGDTALLRGDERPLIVFEQQIAEALPKVKRSSVGSISSIASNLSMHPAIKKLSMNDFTDDSAVKFYLNRRGDGVDGGDDSTVGHGDLMDEMGLADSSMDSDVQIPGRRPQQQLTVLTSTTLSVAAERFTSPTVRFALQIVVYPDDLPDDMAFHPSTEAIVFKDTLSKADVNSVPVVSPSMRRKVFVFPKNVTVAEVIEIALERFGIEEGVVDGGDEIEDKSTKRRSASRVRYGLSVDIGNREKELAPSSRVIEAFPRPPSYRAPDKTSFKRRSVDSTLLLGSMDDVNPEDPTFILRRATTYRNSTSRHRMSAPLDDLALRQLHHHRNSTSSGGSSDPSTAEMGPHQKQSLSRQEIIARQREATRASQQRAILSAQANSVRGMDILLPGNTMLRSSRYDINDRMRYSYVEADGETYDISDIVEEELRDHVTNGRTDLLEGILGRKDTVGEKLNRVLNKIKTGKKDKDFGSIRSLDSSSRRSASGSEYSMDDNTIIDHRSRSVSPPGSAGFGGPSLAELQRSRSASVAEVNNKDSRSGTTTPVQKASTQVPPGADRRQPSIASVMSDLSGYATPPTQLPDESQRKTATPKAQQKRPFVPKDEFGIADMLTIIEYKNAQPRKPLPPIDPVDEVLFGRPIDTQSLHPKIRDIYSPAFKKLEEMDKVLDDYLAQALASY